MTSEDIINTASTETESTDTKSVIELVEHIARNLVDKPDSVVVKEDSVIDGGEVLLVLSVDQEDMGKVIGKQGRIAKAIRSILKSCSIKQGKRYILDIK